MALWDTLPTADLVAIERRLVARLGEARADGDEWSVDYWLDSLDRLDDLLITRGHYDLTE